MPATSSKNDKLDGLKHISLTHRSQLDERRKYEWKIFLPAVTFCILSVAAIHKGDVKLPCKCYFIYIIYLIFIFLAVATIRLLYFVYRANKKNKTIAENAEIAIADLIGKARVFSICSNHDSDNKRDSMVPFWQATMIIIFAFTSAILINLKMPDCGIINWLNRIFN